MALLIKISFKQNTVYPILQGEDGYQRLNQTNLRGLSAINFMVQMKNTFIIIIYMHTTGYIRKIFWYTLVSFIFFRINGQN